MEAWNGKDHNLMVVNMLCMVHNVQYTGVKLSDLILETGLKPKAKWVLAEGRIHQV